MPNYTVTQAAKLLNCSRSQIFKYIKDGKLKTTKADPEIKNSMRLIEPDSVEELARLLKGGEDK